MNPLHFFKRKNPQVTEIKNGRCGNLRYLNESTYAEVYYELSGAPEFDLLVWFNDMKLWSNGTTITEEEKIIIKKAFENWAMENKLKCEW